MSRWRYRLIFYVTATVVVLTLPLAVAFGLLKSASEIAFDAWERLAIVATGARRILEVAEREAQRCVNGKRVEEG